MKKVKGVRESELSGKPSLVQIGPEGTDEKNLLRGTQVSVVASILKNIIIEPSFTNNNRRILVTGTYLLPRAFFESSVKRHGPVGHLTSMKYNYLPRIGGLILRRYLLYYRPCQRTTDYVTYV